MSRLWWDTIVAADRAKHNRYGVKYHCRNCGRDFERIYNIGTPAGPDAKCPTCGVTDSYKKGDQS